MGNHWFSISGDNACFFIIVLSDIDFILLCWILKAWMLSLATEKSQTRSCSVKKSSSRFSF